MKKAVLPIVVILVALAGISAPSFARDEPLVLVENPWTASSLNVNVAKLILEEEMGYEVEIILLDESTQWAAIGAGDAHASLEVWPSGHQQNVEQYINELGVVVDGGLLGPVGKIGWYIPTYLLEDHPDLATWEGFLDPDNAALFATAETGDNGQFLAGAPGWTQYDEQIIENLGLNLEVVYAGSEEAILAAVEAAYRREEPILFYFWTPHSIHAEYDLTEVMLPEYTDVCYEGVAEGNVEDIACDYPADELFKIFWAGLEEAYPDVFTFLSNMNYTTDDQISMVAAVDLDGLTPEEAAEAWVEENEDVWREWLPETD
ncbi:MAG: glycine/betaine ABC transporter substrate-binding protein [Chloroflexi bacterium]|nr:MAG: glycine/betaine ABC transporter substrate-binding protein [Chloroflexota bacterium]